LVIKKEQDRIQKQRGISNSDIVREPQSLSELQLRYKNLLEATVASTVTAKISELEGQIKRLTIEGKLDEAIAIKNGIKTIRETYLSQEVSNLIGTWEDNTFYHLFLAIKKDHSAYSLCNQESSIPNHGIWTLEEDVVFISWDNGRRWRLFRPIDPKSTRMSLGNGNEESIHSIKKLDDATIPLSLKHFINQLGVEQAQPRVSSQTQSAGSASGATLKLSPNWTQPFKTDSCTTEFSGLIFDRATASLDLTHPNSIEIFQGVTYLMPQRQAEKILNKFMASTTTLLCAAWPHDSFFYSSYDCSYTIDSGTYNRLILVLDYAKQVVAVELVDESPQKNTSLPNNYYMRHETGFKIFDFVQTASASPTLAEVVHFVSGGTRTGNSGYSARNDESPSLISVYSEFIDKQTGKTKNRTLLLLPTPLANVILYSIKKYQN